MAEEWLHGWRRDGEYVYIGTGQHCAGCGKTLGIITVVFEEDYEPPAELPDWPFGEDCPLCELRERPTIEQCAEKRGKPNLPGKLGR